MNLELLLRIGGLLQLALLTAGGAMSMVTDMGCELRRLPPFLRQLFWVYLGFIGFVIAGFGALSLLEAGALAQGSPLARCVCGFIALFWLGRLVVQFLVFDVRPYLSSIWLRMGYHATTVVFLYLAVVFAWAAWKGGRP